MLTRSYDSHKKILDVQNLCIFFSNFLLRKILFQTVDVEGGLAIKGGRLEIKVGCSRIRASLYCMCPDIFYFKCWLQVLCLKLLQSYRSVFDPSTWQSKLFSKKKFQSLCVKVFWLHIDHRHSGNVQSVKYKKNTRNTFHQDMTLRSNNYSVCLQAVRLL